LPPKQFFESGQRTNLALSVGLPGGDDEQGGWPGRDFKFRGLVDSRGVPLDTQPGQVRRLGIDLQEPTVTTTVQYHLDSLYAWLGFSGF